MKSIQIDDDLYHFIAANTQHIGESASDILRRLVMPDSISDASKLGNAPSTPNNEPRDIGPEGNNVVQACQANAVFAELEKLQLQSIPKMVERWLLALSVIYKYHGPQFIKVLGMSGRNRRYFATDKETLMETGSSTNPKNVPGSQYWVITNNNTVKKINMLKDVAVIVGFTETEVTHLLSVFAPEHLD